jgi:serine/threonine protein kinase
LSELEIVGVPKSIEYFEDTGKFYLVQELVRGKDLRKYVVGGGVITEEMCSKYILDIGKVLSELRGLGITHRDINPRNVIWDGERFWLVDFGGVKVGRGEGSTIVGTYGYMGMELFRGKAEESTDWYGMGMTLVWMLSGREPEDIGYLEDGELDIGSVDLGMYSARIWGWVRSDWKKRVWDMGEFGSIGVKSYSNLYAIKKEISKSIPIKSVQKRIRVKKFHLHRVMLWLILFVGVCLFGFFSSMFIAYGCVIMYLIGLKGIIRNIWDGGVKESNYDEKGKRIDNLKSTDRWPKLNQSRIDNFSNEGSSLAKFKYGDAKGVK